MDLWKLDNNTYINKNSIMAIEGYFISNHGNAEKYCKIKLIDNRILNIPLEKVEKEFNLSFEIMDYQGKKYYIV